MTTILGVQHKNGFVVAGDSQTTDSGRPFAHPDVKKILEIGNYVIAGAGQAGLVDVYQGGYTPVEMPEGFTGNIYQFLVSKFIPELRQIHADMSTTSKWSNDFEFIIGYKNELFYLASDYSLLRSDTNFYGIGTGYAFGVGALAADATIQQAMKIAAKYDIYTGGKIQIVKRGEQDA